MNSFWEKCVMDKRANKRTGGPKISMTMDLFLYHCIFVANLQEIFTKADKR